MAGIGFELRRFLKEDSYLGLIKAYGFSGIISSGPWVLSILGIMAVGVLSISLDTDATQVIAFLISITYLMACSIILGAWVQLMLTRFISDRLFDQQPEEVLPNLLGALLVTILTSLTISALLWPLFATESLAYRLLMMSTLTVLSSIWILVVMLSGLRAYIKILWVFGIGYGLSLGLSLALRNYGTEGLLTGFFLGQAIMMYLMLALIVHEYPANKLISFDFLDRTRAFYSLVFISLFYNAGVWADKIVFWLHDSTSASSIGPLRYSMVYDPPIFLAYLSIIPGMAVFLLRMEADFVERYDAFYHAVREGDTLVNIRDLKHKMIEIIRQGFFEIFKVQGLTVLLLIYTADSILKVFHISPNFRMLFAVDTAAVGMQVVLLAIFNVFFYLDKRHVILCLTLLFAICNTLLSLLSIHLGPAFYGYGFACSIVLTAIVGLIILNRKLDRLEYETFMLQY